MQLQIIKKISPEIQINFEELKITLKEEVERFKGLVVSKQTIKSSISTQRELAALRRKIDTARKDIKKELTKPIKAFEEECKDLIKLVESAEIPIKDQLEKFEIERKKEVREDIREMLSELATEHEIEIDLNAIEIPKEMLNKTTKKSAISSFVENTIFTIKQEIELKENELKAVHEHIKTMNELLDLGSPILFKDIKRDMKIYSHSELIQRITSIAKRQQRTEQEIEERRLEKIRVNQEKRLAKIQNDKTEALIEDAQIVEDIEPEEEEEEEEDIIETPQPIVKTKYLEVKLDKPKFVALVRFLQSNDIEYKIK